MAGMFDDLIPAQPKAGKTTPGVSFDDLIPAPQVPVSGKADREVSWSDTAKDMGWSAAEGLRNGVQALLGTPGDIQSMFSDVTGWTAGKMGLPADQQEKLRNAARYLPLPGMALPQKMPTTADINQVVEPITGSYSPTTTAGRYTRTVAELAPSAIAGPGGVVRKAVMAVIPGIAMEAAGDLSGQNPYVKVGTGIVAGALTAGRGNAGTKQLLKEAPSVETVAADTKAAYDAIDKAGIVFSQNAYKSAAMKIKSDLAKKGWDKLQGGQVAPLINRVNGMLKPRAVSDWTKVDGILKDAKTILRSQTDETTKMHVGVIVDHLENLVKNGAIASNKSNMSRAQLNETIAKARELARRNIIARDIGKMTNKAEWYVSGPESGLRNKFANYGSRNYQNLSKTEEKAFQAVLNREGVLSPLHSAGSRLGQITIGGIGGYMGGLPGILISTVGSVAARKFMEVYTQRGVDAALKTVLAGRPAQERAALQNAVSAWEARTRAALAADAAVKAGSGENWFLQDSRGTQYALPPPVPAQ